MSRLDWTWYIRMWAPLQTKLVCLLKLAFLSVVIDFLWNLVLWYIFYFRTMYHYSVLSISDTYLPRYASNWCSGFLSFLVHVPCLVLLTMIMYFSAKSTREIKQILRVHYDGVWVGALNYTLTPFLCTKIENCFFFKKKKLPIIFSLIKFMICFPNAKILLLFILQHEYSAKKLKLYSDRYCFRPPPEWGFVCGVIRHNMYFGTKKLI